MASKSDDKLISGLTARKYLNCSKTRFEKLVEQGVIQAHRDEDMRWKVSKKSVLDYVKKRLLSDNTRLIINENHYQEVIQRICAAKSSIRIMTANFKLLNLKPTQNQGERYKDGTPFISSLKDKAVQGVPVQIICSQPTSLVCDELKECYQQINNSNLFDYNFCIRNHAKVVIIDDTIAYIGSANATRAGIGQYTPGNFEVGILTDNPELVSSVNALFSKIWNGDYCDGCHRADKCPEY